MLALLLALMQPNALLLVALLPVGLLDAGPRPAGVWRSANVLLLLLLKGLAGGLGAGEDGSCRVRGWTLLLPPPLLWLLLAERTGCTAGFPPLLLPAERCLLALLLLLVVLADCLPV
jgi:hypothetical protein